MLSFVEHAVSRQDLTGLSGLTAPDGRRCWVRVMLLRQWRICRRRCGWHLPGTVPSCNPPWIAHDSSCQLAPLRCTIRISPCSIVSPVAAHDFKLDSQVKTRTLVVLLILLCFTRCA